MAIDLFLWPMLLPIFALAIYCWLYKKDHLKEALAILAAIAIMIVLYMPMMDLFAKDAIGIGYSITKLILWILLPIAFLFLLTRDKSFLSFRKYGTKKGGARRSVWLFLIFVPIMLVVTFAESMILGVGWDSNIPLGSVMFFESFTEEFLCRGILLVFLMSIIDFRMAYAVSALTFILAHPQYYFPLQLGLVGVIVQTVLTAEIARRSDNIIGAWLLHGTNRFFEMVFLPFLL